MTIDIESNFTQAIKAIRAFCWETFSDYGELKEARDLAESVRANLRARLRAHGHVDALLDSIGADLVRAWLARMDAAGIEPTVNGVPSCRTCGGAWFPEHEC